MSSDVAALEAEVIAVAERAEFSKWALGDALAVLCRETSETHMIDFVRREKFESKYGLSETTIRNYRLVSDKWPPDQRKEGTAWSVHRTLIAPPNRHLLKPGMTLKEARRARMDYSKERRRKAGLTDVKKNEKPGPPDEDTFGPQNPEDHPVSRGDIDVERSVLEDNLQDAVADLEEVALNLEWVADAEWPNRKEWAALLDQAEAHITVIRQEIGDKFTNLSPNGGEGQ